MTLSPVDDAYVAGDNANANFGQATSLQADTNPLRESYLKFNLQSLGGLYISTAKLRMFVTDPSGHFQSVKSVANDTWVEQTLTFNNRPAQGTTVRTFTPGANGWLEVEITSLVASESGSLLSLAIVSSGTNSYGFNSAEAASSRVELVVNHGIITPSPSPSPSPSPTPSPSPAPTPTSITLTLAHVLANAYSDANAFSYTLADFIHRFTQSD